MGILKRERGRGVGFITDSLRIWDFTIQYCTVEASLTGLAEGWKIAWLIGYMIFRGIFNHRLSLELGYGGNWESPVRYWKMGNRGTYFQFRCLVWYVKYILTTVILF